MIAEVHSFPYTVLPCTNFPYYRGCEGVACLFRGGWSYGVV
jgi:hypothetical protein